MGVDHEALRYPRRRHGVRATGLSRQRSPHVGQLDYVTGPPRNEVQIVRERYRRLDGRVKQYPFEQRGHGPHQLEDPFHEQRQGHERERPEN